MLPPILLVRIEKIAMDPRTASQSVDAASFEQALRIALAGQNAQAQTSQPRRRPISSDDNARSGQLPAAVEGGQSDTETVLRGALDTTGSNGVPKYDASPESGGVTMQDVPNRSVEEIEGQTDHSFDDVPPGALLTTVLPDETRGMVPVVPDRKPLSAEASDELLSRTIFSSPVGETGTDQGDAIQSERADSGGDGRVSARVAHATVDGTVEQNRQAVGARPVLHTVRPLEGEVAELARARVVPGEAARSDRPVRMAAESMSGRPLSRTDPGRLAFSMTQESSRADVRHPVGPSVSSVKTAVTTRDILVDGDEPIARLSVVRPAMNDDAPDQITPRAVVANVVTGSSRPVAGHALAAGSQPIEGPEKRPDNTDRTIIPATSDSNARSEISRRGSSAVSASHEVPGGLRETDHEMPPRVAEGPARLKPISDEMTVQSPIPNTERSRPIGSEPSSAPKISSTLLVHPEVPGGAQEWHGSNTGGAAGEVVATVQKESAAPSVKSERADSRQASSPDSPDDQPWNAAATRTLSRADARVPDGSETLARHSGEESRAHAPRQASDTTKPATDAGVKRTPQTDAWDSHPIRGADVSLSVDLSTTKKAAPIQGADSRTRSTQTSQSAHLGESSRRADRNQDRAAHRMRIVPENESRLVQPLTELGDRAGVGGDGVVRSMTAVDQKGPAGRSTESSTPREPVEPAIPKPLGDTATMRIEDANGKSAHIRVTVRGDQVHTRIVHENRDVVSHLTARSDELHEALTNQGFKDPGLSIRAPRSVPESGVAHASVRPGGPVESVETADVREDRQHDQRHERREDHKQDRRDDTRDPRSRRHGRSRDDTRNAQR